MQDKIRFSLGDGTGDRRSESFHIDDSPQYAALEGKLRQYLVGRPLKEVTPGALTEVPEGAPAECRRAVLGAIRDIREVLGVGQA